MGKTKLLGYPVYALSSGDDYIVTSGGGGGNEYGISDRLEIYELGDDRKPDELHLKATTCDQSGVLDSVDFSPSRKLWIGSLDTRTLFFSFDPSTGIKILGKLPTNGPKKDSRQTVCRFGGTDDLFVTGSTDCVVRVWRLSDKLVGEISTGDGHGGDLDASSDRKSTGCPLTKYSANGTVGSHKGAVAVSKSKESTYKVGNDICGFWKPKYKSHQEVDLAVKILQHNVHKKPISDCDISSDSKFVVSVCSELLVVYRLRPPKLFCKKYGSGFKFCRFLRGISPDGQYSIITLNWVSRPTQESTASIWSIDTKGKAKVKLQKHMKVGETQCSALGMSLDEKHFAFGFGVGSVSIYTSDLSLVRTEKRHVLPVTDVSFFKDRKLISSGADFYVVVNDVHPKVLPKYITWFVPILACVFCVVWRNKYTVARSLRGILDLVLP